MRADRRIVTQKHLTARLLKGKDATGALYKGQGIVSHEACGKARTPLLRQCIPAPLCIDRIEKWPWHGAEAQTEMAGGMPRKVDRKHAAVTEKVAAFPKAKRRLDQGRSVDIDRSRKKAGRQELGEYAVAQIGPNRPRRTRPNISCFAMIRALANASRPAT